jgi:hypothetical protein
VTEIRMPVKVETAHSGRLKQRARRGEQLWMRVSGVVGCVEVGIAYVPDSPQRFPQEALRLRGFRIGTYERTRAATMAASDRSGGPFAIEKMAVRVQFSTAKAAGVGIRRGAENAEVTSAVVTLSSSAC